MSSTSSGVSKVDYYCLEIGSEQSWSRRRLKKVNSQISGNHEQEALYDFILFWLCLCYSLAFASASFFLPRRSHPLMPVYVNFFGLFNNLSFCSCFGGVNTVFIVEIGRA